MGLSARGFDVRQAPVAGFGAVLAALCPGEGGLVALDPTSGATRRATCGADLVRYRCEQGWQALVVSGLADQAGVRHAMAAKPGRRNQVRFVLADRYPRQLMRCAHPPDAFPAGTDVTAESTRMAPG
jgi:hypothetical protein